MKSCESSLKQIWETHGLLPDDRRRPAPRMTTRAYSYGAKAPTENAELVRQQLILAHRYANRLVEIERERREASLKADEDEQALEACEAKAAEAIRRARADSGLYWGTYLCVEDAAQRSRRTSREAPRFRRWDGSGLLATQLQGGLAVPDLLAGTDRRAQLVGEGKRRLLRFRVGSTGRDPVWAAFPMVYHRDLPPEATVKWARICCHRLGTHTKWSAQIVLDGLPEVTLPTPTRGTVAIDVGWRRFDEGVRVATWVDDEGETGELLMPHELVERWHKVEDLRSIRDTNFNHARDELREWRSLETLPDSKALPDWLRETTKALHAWRAPARLAALALRWRSQRFEATRPDSSRSRPGGLTIGICSSGKRISERTSCGRGASDTGSSRARWPRTARSSSRSSISGTSPSCLRSPPRKILDCGPLAAGASRRASPSFWPVWRMLRGVLGVNGSRRRQPTRRTRARPAGHSKSSMLRSKSSIAVGSVANAGIRMRTLRGTSCKRRGVARARGAARASNVSRRKGNRRQTHGERRDLQRGGRGARK